MVDIHNHVLPQVDDGAESLQTSLEMLRRGAAEGIEAAVLTPHLEPEDGPEKEEQHRQQFAHLQEALSQAGLPIRIFLGAEVAFRFGLAAAARWPSVALANSRFVLVDLPFGPLPAGLEQGLFELRIAGFKPILGHPERHRHLAERQLERLREQEVLFQVDAGSLIGRFGQGTQEAARMLVERGWAEFVASDGHDLDRRPFSLEGARAWVAAHLGEEEARLLLAENPGRVIRGEAVACRETRQPARKRGALSRLLGAWR